MAITCGIQLLELFVKSPAKKHLQKIGKKFEWNIFYIKLSRTQALTPKHMKDHYKNVSEKNLQNFRPPQIRMARGQ